jgi:hypothetical protein
MMQIKHGTLGGRAVELREVSLRVAYDAGDQGGGRMALLYVLVHSAHGADSGERIFKTIDEALDNMTMRQGHEINALATLAGELNMEQPKPATNGVDAHPSL